MQKELYLLLRDVAISQGHIANIQNDELVIYFFQDPSENINDTFRIHTKINVWEIEIQFSFNERRFKISELGEEKLVSLFKDFKQTAKYNGVIKLSNRTNKDYYELEYSFQEFLLKEKETINQSVIKDFSNKLAFKHNISNEADYIIRDETGLLHFLELGNTSTIRGLSNGKLAFIDKYKSDQVIIFDTAEEMALFFNKCYEDASRVKGLWSSIIENDFYHTFRLEGSSLVFNQWYYSTNVNDLFFNFTELILEAKERLLKYGSKIKREFEDFLFEYPQINIFPYKSETTIVQKKDLIAFQLLHFNFSFLNKKYEIKLDVEPMMNGLVLTIGSGTKLFNIYDFNEFNQLLDNIETEIYTFFESAKTELKDSLDILNLVEKFPILESDTSFISLVGVNRYRFNRIPPNVATTSLITGESSFTIRGFTKEEFSKQLRALIKLDSLLKEFLLSIISYLNFLRPYDKYQIFFAYKREELFIVTPSGSYPIKFRVNNDSSIEFVVINKNFSFIIYPDPVSFFDTVLKGLETIEKQIILSHIFDIHDNSNMELSLIFTRYSLDTSGLYENLSEYKTEEIRLELIKILSNNKFDASPSPSLDHFDQWKEERINGFINLLANNKLLIDYVPLTGAFHIK